MCPQYDAEMEEETAKLHQIISESRHSSPPVSTKFPTEEEQKEIDSRSVHVSNVDWNSTPEDVKKIFNGCGNIRRVTIPKDKHTNRQKNFAFVEFDTCDDAIVALAMDKSELRGRTVSVAPKRTNRPGMGFKKNNNKKKHQKEVIVKYVYVNGPAPIRRRGGFNGQNNKFKPYK